MRKVFSRLAIILTTSSLVLPLTACVYNFYVNSATSAVITSFANQTSSVIKSLVMAKEKSTDTSQTIQDILNEFPNSSIKNQTNWTSLNTWEDFVSHWGLDNNINTDGFNIEDYFIASGSGSLTQQVNTYKTVNNVLDQASLLSGLNVADNRILYDLIKGGDIKNTIIDFLNQTKKTNPDEFPENLKTILVLLKNLVLGSDWSNPDPDSFTKNITNPLTSLLNYLVQGFWTGTETTPIDGTSLNSFMTNWKDEAGKPYSQWNDGTNWKLKEEFYTNWNQNDYNFYYGGVLINHLFYQIGSDYQIKKPESSDYIDRYLGDIITDHISGFNIDQDGLIADLSQYFPHLLENPSYIITLVQGIIPIIKQWGLEMSNIAQGTKNLTFGKKYPTNDDENSYNMLDILKNIKKYLDNPGTYKGSGDIPTPEPGTLRYLIESLVGIAGANETTGNPFTYDVKIKVLILGEKPLGNLINSILTSTIRPLINNELMGLIDSADIKGIFENILNIYELWIKQYDDKNEGINFDLEKLQDFLLNDTNGFITTINRDIIPVLYEIMTNPNPISAADESEYFNFYKSLGGQVPNNPNEPAPTAFRTDSALDILKTNISNSEVPLGQLVLILLGNSSANNNGIFSFVISSNNQWIKDNYTGFFDIENKTNGKVYNLVMKTTIKNNIISDQLTYNFSYRINNKNYTFLIKVQSRDFQDSFTGTKNFYFTDIILQSSN